MLSTTLTGDGLDINADWDGIADPSVTDGPQTLGAGTTAYYQVAVTVRLDGVVTDEAADCELAGGEDGTGLWNSATVTSDLGEASDAACVEVAQPGLSIDKTVIDGPSRDDDGVVTIAFGLAVTNTGAAVTVYDLTDKFAFAPDAIVREVEVVNVEPGGIHVNAGFDGASDTDVTTSWLAPGDTHRYELTVDLTDSYAPTGSGFEFGDDDPDVLAELMTSMGQGAAGKIGGVIAGQALSVIGIGGGTGLADLSVALSDIATALDNIETELENIDHTLLQDACSTRSDKASDGRDSINTVYGQYQSFLAEATKTDTNPHPSPPDDADMEKWVSLVIDGSSSTTSMPQSLSEIDGALMSPPSAQGIIDSCLDPGLHPIPGPGTFDDRTYYETVSGLTTYYYAWQMKGLMMLAEALNWEAIQAIGTLPPDTDPTTFNPCAKYWNDTQHTKCFAAIGYVNQLWDALAKQYEKAGAPYTDDDVGILCRPGGRSPVLLVKSLEKFTNNSGCPTPLTQADPCGLSVGKQTTAGLSNTFPKTYRYYNEWRPATEADMADVFVNWSRGHEVADHMDALGFENANGKVVLFSDTFSWTDTEYDLFDVTVTKFLDTRFPNGILNDGDHMGDYVRHGPLCDGVSTYWAKPKEITAMTDESNRWYNIDYDGCGRAWHSNPGWKTDQSQWTFAKAYRWPAANPATLPCPKSVPHTNAGGAQTMCGTDFNVWFQAQVPRPESCTGGTFGVCDVSSSSSTTLDGSIHDCELAPGEAGTGLLDTATVTHSQGSVSATACAPNPPPDDSRRIAFISGNAARLPAPDRVLVDTLTDAGYNPLPVDDDDIVGNPAFGFAEAAMVSSSVAPSKIPASLRESALPLMNLEGFVSDELGLATRAGEQSTGNNFVIMDDANAGHPLAAGLTGFQGVFPGPQPALNFGEVGGDAIVIATTGGRPRLPTYYAYEAGGELADGATAPARRVAHFPTYRDPLSLTKTGAALFAAAVDWLAEAPPAP